MFNEREIIELTAKFSGIIFKKAQLENNFEKVYSMVFEKILEIESLEEDELLSILGEIGG